MLVIPSLTFREIYTQTTPPVSISPETNNAGSGVQAITTTNQYGSTFLVLVGNTFALNKVLPLGASGLGFKFFKGSWSKRLDFVTPQDRQALTSHGVDLSQADMMSNTPKGPQTVNPEPSKSVASEEIAKFKAKLEEEMAGDTSNNGRTKAMLNFVDKTLDQLANSVDESAKNEFIKAFLHFSSKFWNYSFSNQMLIYFQNRNATHVRGHKQWLELGRQVTNYKNGIAILAPMTKKIEETDQTGQQSERKILFFRPVTVYDLADTQPIPGWKDKKTGLGPFEGRTIENLDPNTDDEQISLLVNAASRFARRLGIQLDLEKDLPPDMGGYSSQGGIAVNKTYKGLNQFSTLVHELAHETLHWNKDQPSLLPKEEMRKLKQSKEIDAESTAYIVLKHFGFETKDAPNYLALWRATSQEVRSRREHIVNAVKVIIKGIDSELSQAVQIQSPDEEKLETVAFIDFPTIKTSNKDNPYWDEIDERERQDKVKRDNKSRRMLKEPLNYQPGLHINPDEDETEEKESSSNYKILYSKRYLSKISI
jgi:hypothetical protein